MRFALITEGVSEYRILKQLLYKYFKDPEPLINPIQPEINNDSQQSGGGWHEVLKYCRLEKLKAVCSENDYVIIQIDSDECENSSFGVSKLNNTGRTKSVQELTSDIINKIQQLITTDIWEKYQSKIIFAICIETIECWLLPVVYTDNKKTRVNRCMEVLNTGLRMKKMAHIPRDKNAKDARNAYDAILKHFKSPKEIERMAKHNFGFCHFVDMLKAIPQA